MKTAKSPASDGTFFSGNRLKSIALLFDMGLEVVLKKANNPDFDARNLTSQLALSQYQNNPLYIWQESSALFEPCLLY